MKTKIENVHSKPSD